MFKLGKNVGICHWDKGLITAPETPKKNPCTYSVHTVQYMYTCSHFITNLIITWIWIKPCDQLNQLSFLAEIDIHVSDIVDLFLAKLSLSCFEKPRFPILLLCFELMLNFPVNNFQSCQAGLSLRVCKENLIFLFLNQNICCGYSKELLNETILLSTQNIC